MVPDVGPIVTEETSDTALVELDPVLSVVPGELGVTEETGTALVITLGLLVGTVVLAPSMVVRPVKVSILTETSFGSAVVVDSRCIGRSVGSSDTVPVPGVDRMVLCVPAPVDLEAGEGLVGASVALELEMD